MSLDFESSASALYRLQPHEYYETPHLRPEGVAGRAVHAESSIWNIVHTGKTSNRLLVTLALLRLLPLLLLLELQTRSLSLDTHCVLVHQLSAEICG